MGGQVAEQRRRQQEPQLHPIAGDELRKPGGGRRQHHQQAEQHHQLGALPVLAAHPPQVHGADERHQCRQRRHRRQRGRLDVRLQQAQLVDRRQLHVRDQLADLDDRLAGQERHRHVGDLGGLGRPLRLGLGGIEEAVGLQVDGHHVGDRRLEGQPLLLGEIPQQDQHRRAAHQAGPHPFEVAGQDAALQLLAGQRQGL